MAKKTYGFIVEGRPRPKKRPRMTRRGRVYTPADPIAYEKTVADAYDGPMFEGPILVRIGYHKDCQTVEIEEMPDATTALRFDIDNAIKATLDGLNGVAYPDDRMVYHVEATKL
jgi:Holliday junction resolvase RusA-like endonuclease